jgi:AmmeMemoRadiSam system protein B
MFLLFGMHLHPQSPCYMMTEGAWETPFGSIEVDRELAAELKELHEFVVETPTDFTPDNTVELQLPFLKYFFPDAKVVALGVPPSIGSLEVGISAVDVARKRGRTVMIVGSTDLTHYGANYGFTAKGTGKSAVSWVREKNDPAVIEAMLDLDPERIVRVAQANQNACCAGAAATAVAGATRLGADKAEHVAYATSYEKSPGDSFVGYVGILMGKKK